MVRRTIGQGQGGRKNKTRIQRMFAVRTVLIAQACSEVDTFLSVPEIALRCGMADSPYFRKIIQDMFYAGEISQREMERPGRWPGFEYAIQGRFQYAPQKTVREVRLNGQLTLWS